MDEFAPTWYSAVPTMHQSILARAPRHADSLRRSRLRFVRSSSAPLPVAVLHELEATFGVPVVEAYGMTEAAHQMTSNPLPPAVRKPGSVGLAAGPEVTVLGPAGAPAAIGEEGDVCIRGASVTPGYLENAAANQESFRHGWFYTGDLGRIDADGYLFLTGRTKEILNRGGEKISPREVDEILMTHPAVRQCLTFALPDSQLGEEVGVVVVPRDNVAVDEAELQHFVAARLADFKVPRRVFFRDDDSDWHNWQAATHRTRRAAGAHTRFLEARAGTTDVGGFGRDERRGRHHRRRARPAGRGPARGILRCRRRLAAGGASAGAARARVWQNLDDGGSLPRLVGQRDCREAGGAPRRSPGAGRAAAGGR